MIDKNFRPSEQHIRQTQKLVSALLPAIRLMADRYGYAIAVHGSLERDIDLIAVPWRDGADSAMSLASAIYYLCAEVLGEIMWIGGWTEKSKFKAPLGSLPNPMLKPYGRLAYGILLGDGHYIDLSITPSIENKKAR